MPLLPCSFSVEERTFLIESSRYIESEDAHSDVQLVGTDKDARAARSTAENSVRVLGDPVQSAVVNFRA